MLLTTKLHIPPGQTSQVARPHLIACLNQGMVCKLTLVSAPAGAGKTSLLSAWIKQLRQPAAWVSLDENDNVPARFLSYILSALQSLQPPPPLSVLPFLILEFLVMPGPEGVLSIVFITLIGLQLHRLRTKQMRAA